MKIVAGLGNPGAAYRCTRHNLGFRVVDRLCEEWGVALRRKPAWQAEAGWCKRFDEPVLLIKPLTFMNASGLSLASALGEQGVQPKDLLVIVDDVALDLGALRLRTRGSAGGHNGLKSVIAELETQDFPRLRVGIAGTEAMGGEGLSDFVLGRFTREEEKIVEDMIPLAANIAQVFVQEGIEKAVSRFNNRV